MRLKLGLGMKYEQGHGQKGAQAGLAAVVGGSEIGKVLTSAHPPLLPALSLVLACVSWLGNIHVMQSNQLIKSGIPAETCNCNY
jgi:hypothetical protein